MFVVGIDYSIASPAICCINHGELRWFYWAKNQNQLGDGRYLFGYREHQGSNGNIRGVARYSQLADWAVDVIRSYDKQPDLIAIESSSFGSSGKVIDLAENLGALKCLLFLGGFKNLVDVAPTSVKKFATQDGRADKYKMYDKFTDCEEIDIAEILGTGNIDSNPFNDIIDSYWLARYAENMVNNEKNSNDGR